MEKSFAPKNTVSMKVVDARQVMAQCSEPLCKITILVEPDEKEPKCISCQMREKLNK